MVLRRKRPAVRRDIAVLPAQIADLAARGIPGVASGLLASIRGIQVLEGGGAVAVGGDGGGVDMVDEGAVEGLGREAVQGDGDVHAGLVGGGGEGDVAGDVAAEAGLDWEVG